MATIKKYCGMRACEWLAQNTVWQSSGSGLTGMPTVTSMDGTVVTPYSIFDSIGRQRTCEHINFLKCNSIFASSDDYSASDTNGTNTESCTFTLNSTTNGLIYTVTFVANENATIKCLKFAKNLWSTISSSVTPKLTLQFGYYFDEPISVQSGDQIIFTIALNYDVTVNT